MALKEEVQQTVIRADPEEPESDDGYRVAWILQPGQVLLDNYRIECIIGAPGGMGQVFSAVDLGLSAVDLGLVSRVAIKVPALHVLLAAGGPEGVLREARTVAQLKHPNIVQLRACLTDRKLSVALGDGRRVALPFIIMEYLEGGDLAHLLSERGPFELPQALDVFSTICDAVHYAHSFQHVHAKHTIRGIVHRDLKPENICFDSKGRVVVLDFGVARLLSDASISMGVTGTPSHMAPEQFNPARGIDGRTDVYALGIILFQMMTGEIPFNADSFERFAQAHLTEEPPDPRELRSDLPDGVAAAIQKALAKEKEGRFDNPTQLARGFREGIRPDKRVYWHLVNRSSEHHTNAHATGGQAKLNELRDGLARTREAKELFGVDAIILNQEGIFLSDLGEYVEALHCFESAIQIDPNWVNVWANKGRTLRELSRQEEALVCYDRALHCDDTQVIPWMSKGNCLVDLGRIDEAIASYEAVLRIDPTNEEAKGKVHRLQRQVRELKEGGD